MDESVERESFVVLATGATGTPASIAKSGSSDRKVGTLAIVNVSRPVFYVMKSSSACPSSVAATRDDRVSSHV